MKKLFFYTGIFMFLSFVGQNSIYEVQVQTVQDNTISMSAFSNKKILITTIDVSPDPAHLQFLDSLQDRDTALKIVAVPSLDFGGVGSDTVFAGISAALGLEFVIAKSAYARKGAGSNQHPLFKWLTDVNENRHFDLDVEAIGQLFVVSRNGTLYSVLPRDVPPEILTQVLNQEMNQ